MQVCEQRGLIPEMVFLLRTWPCARARCAHGPGRARGQQQGRSQADHRPPAGCQHGVLVLLCSAVWTVGYSPMLSARSRCQAIEFAIEVNDPDRWDELIRSSLDKPGMLPCGCRCLP